MILYTIANPEQVLEGIEKERVFQEVEIQGVKVEIEPINLNQGRIVKVISTDCQDYLNQRLQPGNIIRYSPENIL